jgi:hypothetical protein
MLEPPFRCHVRVAPPRRHARGRRTVTTASAGRREAVRGLLGSGNLAGAVGCDPFLPAGQNGPRLGFSRKGRWIFYFISNVFEYIQMIHFVPKFIGYLIEVRKI